MGAVELIHASATLIQNGGSLRPFRYTQSDGTYNGGATATLAMRAGGSFELSGGAFNAPAALMLGGDFAHSGGAFNANGGTTMVLGAQGQTLSGITTFHALTIGSQGSSVITATDPLSITDLLHLKAGHLTGAPSAHHVQIDANNTLTLTGDITVSGDWTNHGTLAIDGHTITYNGAGTQILQEVRSVSSSDGTAGGDIIFLDDGRGGGVTLDALGQDLGTVTTTVRLRDDCTSTAGETFGRCTDIAAELAPDSGVTLAFGFYAADIPAGQSCAAAEVYHWESEVWETLTRAAAFGTDGRQCTAEPYAVRVTGVMGFSPFVLKSDGVPTGDPPDGKHRVYLPLVVRGR